MQAAEGVLAAERVLATERFHSRRGAFFTTGVALVGAAAVAAAPIVISPDLHQNTLPLASVAADPQLTSIATDIAAAVNAIVDGFVATAVEGVAIVDTGIAGGAGLLTQGVTTGSTLLGAGVSFPFDAAKLVTGGFLEAITSVFGVNPITNAIGDIVDGFIGTGGAGDIISAGLRDAISGGALVVNSLIGAGAGLLTTAVTTPAQALADVVVGFQNALTDIAAGDPAAALADIVGGFTAATATVVAGLTDVFNSGVALAGSLITAGSAFVNLAVSVPIASGQRIVQGFIDAFNGVVPPPPAATLAASGVSAAASASVTAHVDAQSSLGTSDTAAVAVPDVAVPDAAVPDKVERPAAAPKATGGLSATISRSLAGLTAGAATSRPDSGTSGTTAGDPGADADAGTTTGGISSDGKRVAPHFGRADSVKTRAKASA